MSNIMSEQGQQEHSHKSHTTNLTRIIYSSHQTKHIATTLLPRNPHSWKPNPKKIQTFSIPPVNVLQFTKNINHITIVTLKFNHGKSTKSYRQKKVDLLGVNQEGLGAKEVEALAISLPLSFSVSKVTAADWGPGAWLGSALGFGPGFEFEFGFGIGSCGFSPSPMKREISWEYKYSIIDWFDWKQRGAVWMPSSSLLCFAF